MSGGPQDEGATGGVRGRGHQAHLGPGDLRRRLASHLPNALDDVVDDLGIYPLEAFVFVSEGLAFTAQRIHGRSSITWRVRRAA